MLLLAETKSALLYIWRSKTHEGLAEKEEC